MACSPTSIDVVDLTGHVVCILEIVDGPYDILDLAVAVERREGLQILRVRSIVKRRDDDTERDGVDADVAGSELHREASGSGDAGTLRQRGKDGRHGLERMLDE